MLEKYGVELIGADIEAIERGENRAAVQGDRRPTSAPSRARSAICHTMDDCLAAVDDLGYPVVVRPSFTMGGAGSGHGLRRGRPAPHRRRRAAGQPDHRGAPRGVDPRLEGVRARADARPHDNVVVVCSIENLDPMGVHTGDSITVAPAMTLTDREYQQMRDVGIASSARSASTPAAATSSSRSTPTTAGMIVIEMNPRVSRSSALASQGHRLPDREDRRPAGHRLHPRRDPQRHHPARPRRPSSRPSTTSSSRCRGSPSRSSRRPTRR